MIHILLVVLLTILALILLVFLGAVVAQMVIARAVFKKAKELAEATAEQIESNKKVQRAAADFAATAQKISETE